MQCGKSVVERMRERDPFLHDNLQRRSYQESVHEAYLRLSHSIAALLRPPTPPPSPPPARRSSKLHSRRSSRAQYRIPNLHLPDPARAPRTEKKRPNSRRSELGRPASRKSELGRPASRKSEFGRPVSRNDLGTPAVSSLGAGQQRYSIRYSKVLDLFKRRVYRDLVARLGLDINSLQDPSPVEVDLAWCKVGSFLLESRDNTLLSYAQFIEETTSVAGDDDRMSVHSYVPPSRAGSVLPPPSRSGALPPVTPASRARSPRYLNVRGPGDRAPSPGDRCGERSEDGMKKGRSESKVPKLPMIGETSSVDGS